MSLITKNLALCTAQFYSQVVHNTEAHIRIMELLLLHGDWSERLPEFASPPQLPPRKVSRPQFPILDPFPVLEDEVVDKTAPGADTGKDQQPHRWSSNSILISIQILI